MTLRPRPQVMRLTDAAAARIRALQAASGKAVEGVRIGVKNGGCAGMEYTMEYAEARAPHDEVVEDKGVRVLINRPCGAGSLFRETRNKPLPAVAKDLGATSWAELFLKFVISHPAVTCAIPATSKPEHLRQNMSAGRGPMPDEAMRKRIADAV